MRKVEISIYTFSELSKEVQDEVIKNIRENNDYPFLNEKLKDELKILLDFNNIKILSICKILRYIHINFLFNMNIYYKL